MSANCHYCHEGPTRDGLMIAIADLRVSSLYLFREQSHPGRAIVAYNRHVGDVTDLSDSERNDFFADVAQASRALQAVFNPDKVNYGAFGDLMQHLHFHLVPKYRDQFEWGGVFAMNPQQTLLSDGEYQEMIEKIRKAL